MLERALQYAKSNFPVFPCCYPGVDGCGCGQGHTERSIGKVPLTRNGLKDASTDPAVVRSYWTQYPRANIGIAIPESFFVLDIDTEHNGFNSLTPLQEAIGLLPETLQITTGSGGVHLWYKTDQPIKNTTRLGNYEGIDIRGIGGYVISPPSIHRNGLPYKKSPVWDGNIMPASLALIELCLQRQPSQGEAGEEMITEGTRNDTLTRMAGAMRRRGASVKAIYSALSVHNQEHCSPPLGEKEIRQIAESNGRYEPAPTHSSDKTSHYQANTGRFISYDNE